MVLDRNIKLEEAFQNNATCGDLIGILKKKLNIIWDIIWRLSTRFKDLYYKNNI